MGLGTKFIRLQDLELCNVSLFLLELPATLKLLLSQKEAAAVGLVECTTITNYLKEAVAYPI